MKIIEGIKTNLGSNYSICNGEDKKTMIMKLAKFRESDKEMFERLKDNGYKRITFYYVTTRVKGLYDLIAYVK